MNFILGALVGAALTAGAIFVPPLLGDDKIAKCIERLKLEQPEIDDPRLMCEVAANGFTKR